VLPELEDGDWAALVITGKPFVFAAGADVTQFPGATRELGDRVLLTEATRCLLTRDGIPLEHRGAIALKGKSDPVPIWAPDLGAIDGGRFEGAVPAGKPEPVLE